MVMIVAPVTWFAPVVPSTQLPKLTRLAWHSSEPRLSAQVWVFHLATPSNPDIQHTQIHLPPVHPHLNLLLQSSTTQNLGQTVGNVALASRDEYPPHHLPDLGSRSLANSMVANTQMLLRKLGLGNGSSIDNSLVVTPCDGRAVERNPHHPQLVTHILDKFKAGSHSHNFRSKGRRFNGSLMLRKPKDRRRHKEDNDAGMAPTSKLVPGMVGIDPSGDLDGLTTRLRCISDGISSLTSP